MKWLVNYLMCQAWHRASRAEFLMPGIEGAEDWEKGKGVIVMWGLKEAQSTALSAGRTDPD